MEYIVYIVYGGRVKIQIIEEYYFTPVSFYKPSESYSFTCPPTYAECGRM